MFRNTTLRQTAHWLPAAGLVLAAVWLAFALLAAPQALAQDSTNEIELVGVIQAYDGVSLLTVNDLTIDASTAEISTPLDVGLAVRVEGWLLTDGTVQAREIAPAEDDIMPGELETVGVLTSIDAAVAVVSGLTFDITAAEVEPGLVPGDVVEVHARLVDTTWVAREIARHMSDSMDDPSPDDSSDDMSEDFEITGTLQEIGDGYIIVSDQMIDTQTAEIHGPLVVGALVSVEVHWVDDVLVAHEVTPVTPDDDSQDDSQDDDSPDDSDDDSDAADDSPDDGDDDSDDDSPDSSSDACQFEVEVNSANLRSGPGTGYDVVGYAFDGDTFAVLQIDSTGAWVQVATDQGEAWIAVSVGELDDCANLNVSDMPFLAQDSASDDGPNHDVNDDRVDDDSSDDDSSDDAEDHEDDGDDDSQDDSEDHEDDGDDSPDDGDDHEDDGDDSPDDGEDEPDDSPDDGDH